MMQLRPSPETVAPRLAALLKSPALPARAALAGQQLLQRLTSPIRLAILGHPGSGKSQLLNLIAGERIIPPGAALPTVELRFGSARRVLLVGADESVREVPLSALGSLGRDAAAMVRIEAPLPILSALTLIEVSGAGTAGEERAAVQWAAARADMVIWCSQAFTAAERWLWSAMPDRLKDHGFLVLTKADELIRAGSFAAQMAELEEVVAEEFHSLVPVATLQGLAAMCGDRGTDREALAASGAEALIAALLGHVEQGRRADLDAALLFLSRFGGGAAEAAPAPVQVAEVPAPAAAAAAVEVPETVPAEATVEAEAPAADESVARAIDILQGAAGPLLARMDAAGHAEDILEGCAQAAQAVADTIDPVALPDLHDEALEVAEMLVLLGLERSETAAADAVTLLLQLRRDLSYAEAA
jgi:energy-coupling factor transporter ATP-binding protein EcfA2